MAVILKTFFRYLTNTSFWGICVYPYNLKSVKRLANTNDRDLIIGLRQGDVSAFKELFQLYYQPLCIYCCSVVKDMQVAEDVVQAVFVKLWEKRDTLDVSGSAKSYLYSWVHNSSLNELSKEKIRRDYQAQRVIRGETHTNDTWEKLITSELAQEIKRVINLLPPQCRKIFLKSRYEGKKYEDIADELGLSVKTIEVQMGKALRIFREQLAGFGLGLIVFLF